MRKFKLDLNQIAVHTFDISSDPAAGGVTVDPFACSGVYCSLAERCEDPGALPTPRGITCDNA